MAVVCPVCGSADTQSLVDKGQCLNCGSLIAADGSVAQPGIDESTRTVLAKALEPRQVNLVGNMADLQRAGAVGAFADTNAKADVGSQTDANEAHNQRLADKADSAASDQLDAAQALLDEKKEALQKSSSTGDAVITTTNSGSANG